MLAKVDLKNDLLLSIKRSPLNAASSDAVFNLGDMKYMIWLCSFTTRKKGAVHIL